MSRFLLLEQIPGDVLAAIDDPAVMKAAWNAQFERTCIGKYLGRWLDPDSWFCTMAHAAELSLPLALKNAAAVLKTWEQKDKAGEALIKYFSVPCKPTKSNGGRTRNLPEHDPESWTKFKEYCCQDVRTERDIRKKVERFPMTEMEWNFYHLDQRINDRGVRIDKELVQQAIACDLALSDEMTKRAYELTGPKTRIEYNREAEERTMDTEESLRLTGERNRLLLERAEAANREMHVRLLLERAEIMKGVGGSAEEPADGKCEDYEEFFRLTRANTSLNRKPELGLERSQAFDQSLVTRYVEKVEVGKDSGYMVTLKGGVEIEVE